MEDAKYIGSRLIKKVIDNPKDKDGVIVTLESDGLTEEKTKEDVTLRRKLYDLIVKTEKGNGDTIENVANTYIAAKFLMEIADYGFEKRQIISSTNAILTLSTNLLEERIGAKFGVSGVDRIKISDLIE